MKIVRTIQELRDEIDGSTSVGLVPTMGAFHSGHVELFRRSTTENTSTVVSLFVNPLQFGPHEDFERYPRDERRDAEIAMEAGVDCLFVPDPAEILKGRQVSVLVQGVSDQWEGQQRPGHFDGVATIVLKLLLIVRPHVAYFGLKDLQQCAVVGQMVRELFVDCRLEFVETVRGPDGLALSSRNQYLTPKEKSVAPYLYKAIQETARRIGSGNVDQDVAIADCSHSLREAGFTPDYVAIVDPETMKPPRTVTKKCRVIAAARLGSVRLIDNVGLPDP